TLSLTRAPPPPPPHSTPFPYTTLFRSPGVNGTKLAGASMETGWLKREYVALPSARISGKRIVVPPWPGIVPPGSSSVTRHRRRRSEEHTSELQSPYDLVCRLLLEKKKQ